MKILNLFCRLALLSRLGSASSRAQIRTARLTGTVTDASGAAMAKAQVTITNERTGAPRVVATGDDGSYIVLSLTPSEYDVKVAVDGFATSEVKRLVLGVGQSTDGGRGCIERDSGCGRDGGARYVFGKDRRDDRRPRDYEQISQLYLLVPGATYAGSGRFDKIRFYGRAVEQNIIRVDGIEATSIIEL